MKEPKRYLVTSALPYANGPLHIGHLAGAYLSADVYVRFLRLLGKEVVFICGSDEHGAAITMRAKKEGKSPKEIIDRYHELFDDTFKKMGISFDIYHRTSDPLHHKTSQDFFRTLYEKGEFEKKTTEQYYDLEANQFLADRYITGTCPKCDHPEAYGDQCENCGSTLNPTDLINPKSTLSGGKPVLKETTHWYLPLDKYEPWLREWIETGVLDGVKLHEPSEWKNHVLGQCKSWLDQGLQPRSMTRDLEWGVDVPKDIPGHEGKKLYVWMDAPIGYISATKQWALNHGKDWKKFWQDKETSLVHFIGKDNIVFHCLIFPAILKAHGDFVLPVNVPANQFMNLEGSKISTSKNWAVWVHEYVQEFQGMEDVLRYNMVKNMPELKDSEFTWKSFQESNNNELVNNLANFINRVIVLTNKYYDGIVPDYNSDLNFFSSTGNEEKTNVAGELLILNSKMSNIVDSAMKFDFRGSLQYFMDISAAGNQLLQFNEPWKTVKTDPDAVRCVLFSALQYVAALAVVCRPFLPFTSDKISSILGQEPIRENGELESILTQTLNGNPLITPKQSIGKPEHLFTRIDDSVIQAQVDKLGQKEEKSDMEAGNVKPTITYDDFAKLDMRTATVLKAEKVEKADKLLQIQLDLGFEQRTVLSGIAQHYSPDEIIGKKVVLLANLAPRKIRGIMSNGMILMAEDKDGKLAFVAPPEGWSNGDAIS